VRVPFWFKHFGSPKNGGAGDAYHIGVFGRTGSGKTTAAANMVLGYARHTNDMSILILDPQGQFYNDINVIPDKKFSDAITACGAKYQKIAIPDEVHLPDDAQLFAELLHSGSFIGEAFDITTEDKKEAMRESIEIYVKSRLNSFAGFSLSKCSPVEFLSQMIEAFLKTNDSDVRTVVRKKMAVRSF
jgi:hypothetical protein